MDNYMKDYLEAQINTSETKIKLMEAGLKAMMSNPDNIEVETLGSFVNAINNEKGINDTLKKRLSEYIADAAKEKEKAKIKLGLTGGTHE